MHNVPSNQTDFRQTLKTATQPLHDALEKTALAQSLASGNVSIHVYTSYLSRLYLLHSYVESGITIFSEWKTYGIDPSERCRLPMLHRDLKSLGVKSSHLNREWIWQHPWNFPSAVGVMYVLEGSTMGGLFLAQRLQHLLGEDNLPATRYFRGYGDQTIPRWNDYCRFLNQYASDHPDDQSQITEAACAMFANLKEVLHAFD